MGRKATDATVTQRIRIVLQLKMAGAEFPEIAQHVREKEQAGEQPWTMEADLKPLSQRTLWFYHRRAKLFIAQIARQQQPNALHLRILRHIGVYARALAKRDWPTALRVLRDLAELEANDPRAQAFGFAETFTAAAERILVEGADPVADL